MGQKFNKYNTRYIKFYFLSYPSKGLLIQTVQDMLYEEDDFFKIRFLGEMNIELESDREALAAIVSSIHTEVCFDILKGVLLQPTANQEALF